MLAKLTQHDFDQCVNQPFKVHLDSEQQDTEIDLELIDVQFLRESVNEGGRDQFSLLFKGGSEVILPQQTYQLENNKMGKLDIFLVPIGREDNQNNDPTRAVIYESVFT